MYLQEIGWEGMVWIALAHGREKWWAVVNTVMNSSGSIKCGFLD
jgi:hypothetical protein